MTLLMGGAALGAVVGVALLAGLHLPVPWLVAVGLTKLTLVSAGGLMAAGAFCLRLDRRKTDRLQGEAHRATELPQRSSQE